MYPIHGVRPKETVSYEGLVVLTPEAINVTIICRHLSQNGTFCFKVIPGQPQEVSGAVAELLVFGDHMDVLVQELAHFILVDPILDHNDQDLDSHCSLLIVCWFRCGRRGEEQGQACWRFKNRNYKDVALEKGLT